MSQPPTVNPDLFSNGASAGLIPEVVVATAEFWVILIVPTTGVTALSFTLVASVAFRDSLSSLLRSFSQLSPGN